MTQPSSMLQSKSSSWFGRVVFQPVAFTHVLREVATLSTRHRRLIVEMAKREITDAFAGSYLGVAWSVLHPLIMMAVYALVFAFVFRGRSPTPWCWTARP